MKWFQIKEKSAGAKRLLLCWYIYNVLGKKFVRLIAFFVALITFFTYKDLRNYTSKYFNILKEYTSNNDYKPSVLNCFKNVLAYSYSLVDKMEIFTNKLDSSKIVFVDMNDERMLFDDLSSKKGIFFVCNHVGNIEILRSLLYNTNTVIKPDISVFLQKNQCEIFNEFINSISCNVTKIKTYPIEEIDLTTAFEIKDSLDNGNIVFMAGDRVPVNTTLKLTKTKILGRNVSIPQGVFKFAKSLDTVVYFISCVENKNNYEIYLQKATDSTNIEKMQDEFSNFTTRMICNSPYQFFNFYDFFNEEN